MDIAIIPAYNPDYKLIELTWELHETGIDHIIIVNDGSEEQTQTIFKELRLSATVLTHEVNKGKGAAIKTALQYITNNLFDIKGIIILDADGQHRPIDAKRILDVVHSLSSGLVLGVRNFDGKIPFRSLFGNTITKYVFRICSGKWVSDTQTGLRGFSKDLVPKLLQVTGDRYEYEMNVLLTCAKDKTNISEVPIATIYHDKNNSCSHFRAIRDSARIYGNLLAFSGASFVSFLLDYILFFLIVQALEFSFAEKTAIIIGNVSARFISAAFNYYLNSTFIFKYKERRLQSIIHYAMLACFILAMNTIILFCLHEYIGLNKAIAKLITELTLFVISFTVQKFIIFKKA